MKAAVAAGVTARIDGPAAFALTRSVTFANPIVAAGLSGLLALYAERAVTPVEACEVYLSRIKGLDGALGAFVHVDAEGARAAAHDSAERWRRGEARSLLDGAPIAIKANIAVAGWPWHAGIAAYRTRLAEMDADIVARLREAGAVLLGLTNMEEGAFGAVTDNPHFGRTHNPWDYDRTAGGSSGGSAAAVAAGLCVAALGTDTLGSVRIPSGFCGLYGHRPTPGLAPTDGLAPMSWTLDQPGVHARSAEDAGRLFAGICAAEPELAADLADPASSDELRAQFADTPLGLLTAEGVALSPEAVRAQEIAAAAARNAGLTVEPAHLGHIDLAEVRRLAMFVCAAESVAAHAEALAGDPDGFSPAYRAKLEIATSRTAADFARAQHDLAAASDAIREALSGYAAVILPTTPVAPFTFETAQPEATSQLTTLASVAGLAATAFPMGLDEAGLPRSVQAVAWDDETSLGLAALLAADPGAPPAYRG